MTAYEFACVETATTSDSPTWVPNQFVGASNGIAVDDCVVWWHWDYPVVRDKLASSVACRATLTGAARRYLARAPATGLYLQPTRWILGTGLGHDPSWMRPAIASRDTTYVTNYWATGSVVFGDLIVESANASSLSIKCRGPIITDGTVVRDLLIWARIYNNPTTLGKEIPFASVKLQPWHVVHGQRFAARVVIPLGDGTYEAPYPYFSAANHQERQTASDAVTVEVSYVKEHHEALHTYREVVTVV